MRGAEERLRQAEKEHREQIADDNRRAEGVRLRNGADCPWTAATDISDLHCCKNGRLLSRMDVSQVAAANRDGSQITLC
jgi:hypothetical protein